MLQQRYRHNDTITQWDIGDQQISTTEHREPDH
jgi:hypothetical protein